MDLARHGFIGDDFTIGAAGERWVIDSIRTWAVPGQSQSDPPHLGDYFQDVRFYFGGSEGDLSPVITGQFAPGGDATGNSNIRISEATQAGAVLYDEFGTSYRIWQLDFGSLNLTVDGGQKYRFGVWGMGRGIPGKEGKTYLWFNHASNAGLSGGRQDGADGQMLEFDAAGRSEGALNAEGHGWDKPADINIQVFAHRVARPVPETHR